MNSIGDGAVQVKVEEGEKKDVDFEAILAFLRQRGLRETESLLQRELTSSTDQVPTL
jgi:hypothetical protein